MAKGIIVAATVAALALTAAGCSQTTGPGEGVGTVAGAVGGALIGSAIGGGAGKVAAIAAGTVIGGFLGNRVGASIDAESQRQAYYAQNTAVSTGSRYDWRTGSAYGYVEPGPVYTDARGTCRRYTHTIYVNGTPQAGQGVACRNPDGTWQIVS
jgi:surface antigen